MKSQHSYEEALGMQLFALIAEYREYHLAAQEIARSTLNGYCARLRSVCRLISDSPVVADLTLPTLRRVYLERSKASPRCAMLYRFAMMHFCDYLIKAGWLQTNLARELPCPRLAPARREPIADTTIEELLSACDRMPRKEEYRCLSRAVISVLAFAGLRKAELLNLKAADVNLSERSLQVWEGKGKKHRTVYPAPECINALRAWLKLRPACEGGWLFALSARRRLGDHGLYSILEKAKIVAGHRGEKMTPHQFRHSCASRLANNGAPLPAVQQFLGHSSLTHTAIYIHSDPAAQKKIAHLGSLRPETGKEETKETPQRKAADPGKEDRRRRIERLK